MSNKTVKESFEIKKVTEESIVYQRVMDSKGRKPKKVQEILSNLPTTTLHTFTLEDYERLKEIETKLLDEIDFKNKPNISILQRVLSSFFEL